MPCYQLRSLWWSWTCLFRFCCLWASHLTRSLFPPLGSGADNTHPNYLTGTLWKSWDDKCESTFWTRQCNPHWESDYNDLYPLRWLTSPSHLQSSPAPSACSNLSWVQGLAFQELSPGSWIGSFPSNSAFARCPNGSPWSFKYRSHREVVQWSVYGSGELARDPSCGTCYVRDLWQAT